MTESLLADVREKEARAARRAMKSWQRNGIPRRKLDRDRLAGEVSRLIVEAVTGEWGLRKLRRPGRTMSFSCCRPSPRLGGSVQRSAFLLEE